MDVFVRTVATNIRRLRRHAGLTLVELAGQAGLGKSTLAQLESGKGNPSVETLWAIAAALRVPFGRIVEEDAPALRIVRASEQPALRSAETSQVGRLLTPRTGGGRSSSTRWTSARRHGTPTRTTPASSSTCSSSRARCGSGPPTGRSSSRRRPRHLPRRRPHVYQGLPAAHYALLMSYP